MGGPGEDAVIKARIESELFRDGTEPKGEALVDVLGGVAVVRGEVTPDPVDEVPVLVSAVEGVVRVDSFLHARGPPRRRSAERGLRPPLLPGYSALLSTGSECH